MTEKKPIQITLLANEGILVQYNGIKVLIDGIHKNDNGAFSGLSDQVLKDLIEGNRPFLKNIDYVLFTHCHNDHFSAGDTAAFLEKHSVKGLFMPDKGTYEFSSLREIAKRQSDYTLLLDLEPREKKQIALQEDFSLTIFRSIHAGAEYADVDHFCYLLDFGGRKLFIIGDSEYNADYFAQMLAGVDIEAAFINPLFLNKHDGREVMLVLNAGKLIIYHIPFEGSDKLGFRKLVLQDVRKYHDIMPEILVLWDELQYITI